MNGGYQALFTFLGQGTVLGYCVVKVFTGDKVAFFISSTVDFTWWKLTLQVPHLNEVPPSSIGFKCEEHENPADFFLDVINLCEKVDKDWEKQGGQRCTIVGIPPVYFISAILYLLA